MHLEDDNLRVPPHWDMEALLFARTGEDRSRETCFMGASLWSLIPKNGFVRGPLDHLNIPLLGGRYLQLLLLK